jgi:cytochrome c
MRAIDFAVFAALVPTALWPEQGDPATRGRELFARRCGGCHAADATKVGPALRGVFGRAAAAVPKFPYSDALRKARLVWDDATLDRWLADPEAVAPDNDMSFHLDRADERAAIITYLKQLSAKEGQR